MPEIVGIRFKRAGKTYDFDAADLPLKPNDIVVVESDFGLSLGKVVKQKRYVEAFDRPLKQVLRIATEEDLNAVTENKNLEKEAYDYCLQRIKARGMQMKLVSTEATIDRKRIIFYFTADGRIDFRELVKDLAAHFRTRIEMRQIGVRDESKMIGGIGICGRELCCCTFLSTFDPVAIKMAKDQELVLNVAKLSGLCGRLMCCLRYEFEGDLKEVALEDEPIPQDEPIILEEREATMATILSTIKEEDKEPIAECTNDRQLQKQVNYSEGEDNNKEEETTNLATHHKESSKTLERRGFFKRRRHFKR